MRYEVKSNQDSKKIVAWTEDPACIDDIDIQKAMVAAGYKIVFSGTQQEYEKVKKDLDKHVNVKVKCDGADIKEPKRDVPKRTRQRRVSETTSEQISLLQTVQKPKRGRRPKIT